MASVSGESGSSGGGGNPPSNELSKMKIESSSDPQSESKQGSLPPNPPGSVSSMMRVQTRHLKCVVCMDYPRKEVHQCHEGHIVCNECIAKITQCPFCRVRYTENKIRVRAVETDLDDMTYRCSFRSAGCKMENIQRSHRTAHELQCDFK